MEAKEWHLEKGVSLSHIIATGTLLIAGVAAFYGLQERISILEREFVNLSERVVRVLEAQQRVDDAQDRDLVSFRNEVRTDIRQINDKLDRLIEGLTD